MRKVALWILSCLTVPVLLAQDDFGSAVKNSLLRSRTLFPESAQPDSPLSRAILARIAWLEQNNPDFFTNPDWPMKLAAAEALALGVRARQTPGETQTTEGRYLAQVTRSFSVEGASFRKGQQIVLEEVRDHRKRGITIVDGRPILIWLDNIKVLRQLAYNDPGPAVVKVDAARYGFADQPGYSVSNRVQSALASAGSNSLLVSDSLVTPGVAQKLQRHPSAVVRFDPQTGQLIAPSRKMLTVTYTLNGSIKKTKQALEGQTLVLD